MFWWLTSQISSASSRREKECGWRKKSWSSLASSNEWIIAVRVAHQVDVERLLEDLLGAPQHGRVEGVGRRLVDQHAAPPSHSWSRR